MQQVVDWLSLPADKRPDLVTFIFLWSIQRAIPRPAARQHSPPSLRWIVRLRCWRAIESINSQQGADISLMLVSDHGIRGCPNLFIDTNTLPAKGFKRASWQHAGYVPAGLTDIDGLAGAG